MYVLVRTMGVYKLKEKREKKEKKLTEATINILRRNEYHKQCKREIFFSFTKKR